MTKKENIVTFNGTSGGAVYVMVPDIQSVEYCTDVVTCIVMAGHSVKVQATVDSVLQEIGWKV